MTNDAFTADWRVHSLQVAKVRPLNRSFHQIYLDREMVWDSRAAVMLDQGLEASRTLALPSPAARSLTSAGYGFETSNPESGCPRLPESCCRSQSRDYRSIRLLQSSVHRLVQFRSQHGAYSAQERRN